MLQLFVKNTKTGSIMFEFIDTAESAASVAELIAERNWPGEPYEYGVNEI